MQTIQNELFIFFSSLAFLRISFVFVNLITFVRLLSMCVCARNEICAKQIIWCNSFHIINCGNHKNTHTRTHIHLCQSGYLSVTQYLPVRWKLLSKNIASNWQYCLLHLKIQAEKKEISIEYSTTTLSSSLLYYFFFFIIIFFLLWKSFSFIWIFTTTEWLIFIATAPKYFA